MKLRWPTPHSAALSKLNFFSTHRSQVTLKTGKAAAKFGAFFNIGQVQTQSLIWNGPRKTDHTLLSPPTTAESHINARRIAFDYS
ncbi:unnamed protein product [Toxocara canis]|uniref:Uncharacterized protein n=1 Tax=Toxocara canis TaxID=6265 RepID=A0A183UBR0_TOXCA|nr:unnamed protein product [Toxocara canis]